MGMSELSILTAWGQKLLLSLSVLDIRLQKRSSDFSTLKSPVGWVESLMIFIALVCTGWCRCPARRAGLTCRCALLNAPLSAVLRGLGWNSSQTRMWEKIQSAVTERNAQGRVSELGGQYMGDYGVEGRAIVYKEQSHRVPRTAVCVGERGACSDEVLWEGDPLKALHHERCESYRTVVFKKHRLAVLRQRDNNRSFKACGDHRLNQGVI